MTRAKEPEFGAPEAQINYLVSRLERVLRIEIAQDLAALGLSVPEHTAMQTLLAGGAMSNAQLARASYISPQGMNQVLTTLEDRRLVSRSTSETHQRIRPARLTAEGLRLAREAFRAARRVERRMMQDVSAADERVFVSTLERAIESLGRPIAVEADAPTPLQAYRRRPTSSA